MHRLAVSAKRKVLLNPKTVGIYAIAIFFTFLLAYNQRLGQNLKKDDIHISRVINMRSPKNVETFQNGSAEENHQKLQTFTENGVCQRPPKEVNTDLNTFDIFETVVAKGKALSDPAPKLPKPEKLRVYVLPFTHVDPGWLETFESYTKRTNEILDNMHNFMMKNEKMRFMWAEFVFFERWWSLKNESVRTDVKKLVAEGRLELATGSWVMTDEANPYFPVSVDNIVEGFQFIHQNFGIKPSTIWSNDPFGYSNSVPYLFKKSGVHRNVINRIHHSIKGALQSQKAIPFQWRQYFDKDGENDVLTQILPYTHYDILNSCGSDASVCCEFDFKRITHWSCPGPKPVEITKSNVASKADKLMTQLEKMAKMYKAPVILMMHGDDFRFDMIEEWHQQHDNFIPVFEEINKGSRVEIKFGTFKDYFDDLEKWYSENAEFQPPTLSGDFFPYMCALGDYWTGYYTTRPFFKRQGRLLHSLIRNADIMLSMLRGNLKQRKINENVKRLEESRRNLALFQHHDAITGTSKVSVMDNYSELLHSSILSTKIVLENLTKSELDMYPRIHDGVEIQQLVNLDASDLREIRIFNSLLFTITDIFGIRVDSKDAVVSIDGKIQKAQIEPYFQKAKTEKDSFLLLFKATVPPLSMIKVGVQKGDSGGLTTIAKVESSASEKWDLGSSWKIDTSVSSDLNSPFLKVTIDPATGSLQKVLKLSDKSSFDCQQSWHNYKESGGGAYLMRVHTNPSQVKEFQWLKVSGPLRQSIYQKSETTFQRTSIKNVEGNAGEELDVSMSIDITSVKNTELMTRFTTNWETPTTYTDSVGMQLLKRGFYKLPVQSNYYPMPSAAVLESGTERISIVSNVEHGARFLESGTVEINIDRMLNQDDGKGLGTGSDSIPIDLKPVDMKFKLTFDSLENPETSGSSHYSTHSFRAQQALQSIIYPPLLFDAKPKKEEDTEEIEENSNLKFPCDVQLLTIRPLANDQQLLTFYRHATSCSKQKQRNCGAEFKNSLTDLLIKLGAKRVQKTDLSGVTPLGERVKVEYLTDVDLKVFDFLTLVVHL